MKRYLDRKNHDGTVRKTVDPIVDKLSSVQRDVLNSLIDFYPQIYPSNQTLGDCKGKSPESIRRIIAQLEQLGLLARHHRFGKTNFIELHILERIDKYSNVIHLHTHHKVEGLSKKDLSSLSSLRENNNTISKDIGETNVSHISSKQQDQKSEEKNPKTATMEEKVGVEKTAVAGVKKCASLMACDFGFGSVSIDAVSDVSKSTSVFYWFKDALLRLNGKQFIISPWTVKQKKLAKDLLKIYGAPLVKKAVDWFCDNWGEIVDKSRGRLRGAPSIGLLWSMREMVFGEVQGAHNGRRRPSGGRGFDEWKDDGGNVVGW